MTHTEMMKSLRGFMQKVIKDKNVTVTDNECEAMEKALLLLEYAFEKYEEKYRQNPKR